jgi:hypothetical protein
LLLIAQVDLKIQEQRVDFEIEYADNERSKEGGVDLVPAKVNQ